MSQRILDTISSPADLKDLSYEQLDELAKEIRAALRDNEKYSDWTNSIQIKALMQADIIMILAKHGYPPVPPEIYEKVYNDILEQAENFKKYSDD